MVILIVIVVRETDRQTDKARQVQTSDRGNSCEENIRRGDAGFTDDRRPKVADTDLETRLNHA